MSLAKCRECGAEVSTSAKVCPKCGVSKPVKRTSIFVKLLAGFFGFAIFGSVVSQCTAFEKKVEDQRREEAERARVASLSPEEKAAEEKKLAEEKAAKEQKEAARKKKDEAEKKLHDMALECALRWERVFEKSLNDPSSLDWDRSSATLATYKKNTTVVLVPYRAKNAFGALILKHAMCIVDPKNGTFISVVQ